MKDIKRVCVCFFSPCGNTKKVAMTVGTKLAALLNANYELEDFTLPKNRNSDLQYDEDDMVVIASPVYAGRVPNKLMPYIKDNIKGHNTKCVAMVTFGNRAYDDALQELIKMMSDNGMKVIGAAAVCCEHSFASELATGHPNQSDEENMLEFAQKCFDVIKDEQDGVIDVPGDKTLSHYYKPLKSDNTPAVFLKATPKVDYDKCSKCGKCAMVCPMDSVNAKTFAAEGICIKCQACIKACPNRARYFDDEDFLSHVQNLILNQSKLKKSEYFVLLRCRHPRDYQLTL